MVSSTLIGGCVLRKCRFVQQLQESTGTQLAEQNEFCFFNNVKKYFVNNGMKDIINRSTRSMHSSFCQQKAFRNL